MRYAVVADLHGKRKAWRRVLDDVQRRGADRIVCLGDYLDAKVPWRGHDSTTRRDVTDVVEPDPRLWRELAGVDLVLGNQEWRIRDLLRDEQTVGDLDVLLAAPATRMIGAATAMHGHQFSWDDGPICPGWPAVLYPRLAQLPDVPILMVGHSHQVLLLDLLSLGDPAGAVLARRRPVTPGRPIPVDPGGARRLFVNVGPARGKPSRWLLYDDTASEMTFHEAVSQR
ncbi:metallophosphoesterase family protein [Frankia sp. Cr2]|uniref:metallophosphoesterase family protein n=1 Tax=Frankia sp. Cr2 TaxID=3073932 RepID=UPI002AD28E48|nr:metallophosphoesterase [Frankia sp. Cr2]